MGERRQIGDEIDRGMPGVEQQKVADDAKAVTSHAGTQPLQARRPTVEPISVDGFSVPLAAIKEGIPMEQDPLLIRKLAAQSLLGNNVVLQGGR
jgi:hypothetical protein